MIDVSNARWALDRNAVEVGDALGRRAMRVRCKRVQGAPEVFAGSKLLASVSVTLVIRVAPQQKATPRPNT